MREIIACAAVAAALAVVWACLAVLATYGGPSRILEGSFLLGIPATLSAAGIAACSKLLVRRFSWSLPTACASSGFVAGVLLGAGSAVDLRNDMSVTSSVWLQQIAAFAGIGVVLGLAVFCVLWTARRRRRTV